MGTFVRKFLLSPVQFWVLQERHKLWSGKNIFEQCEKSNLKMFDKVCGTDKVRLVFTQTFQATSILPLGNKDIALFRDRVKQFFFVQIKINGWDAEGKDPKGQ